MTWQHTQHVRPSPDEGWPDGLQLRLNAPNEAWKRLANCRGIAVEVFYPPPHRGRPPDDYVEPWRAMCESCVVREACAQYAFDWGIKFGVWGGMNGLERRRWNREHRRTLASG